MGLLKLLEAAVKTVTLPVDILRDVVKMPMDLIDYNSADSSTIDKLKDIAKDIDEIAD